MKSICWKHLKRSGPSVTIIILSYDDQSYHHTNHISYLKSVWPRKPYIIWRNIILVTCAHHPDLIYMMISIVIFLAEDCLQRLLHRSSFCCTHVFFLSTWQILCLISHTLDAGGDLMPSLSEHCRLGLFCLPAELSAGLNVKVESTSAKQRRHLNIVTLECKIFKFNNNVNTGLKTHMKCQI